MPVTYTADAKANTNELACAPGIVIDRFHGIDDPDWERPATVAAVAAEIGSRPDGTFDPAAADKMLADMRYRRTGPWANEYPQNYGGPRGQWSASVEPIPGGNTETSSDA